MFVNTGNVPFYHWWEICNSVYLLLYLYFTILNQNIVLTCQSLLTLNIIKLKSLTHYDDFFLFVTSLLITNELILAHKQKFHSFIWQIWIEYITLYGLCILLNKALLWKLRYQYFAWNHSPSFGKRGCKYLTRFTTSKNTTQLELTLKRSN